MKYCPRCETDKPTTEWYHSRTTGLIAHGYCKECMRDYQRGRYQTAILQDEPAFRARQKAYAEKFRESNRLHYKEYQRAYHLARRRCGNSKTEDQT